MLRDTSLNASINNSNKSIRNKTNRNLILIEIMLIVIAITEKENILIVITMIV